VHAFDPFCRQARCSDRCYCASQGHVVLGSASSIGSSEAPTADLTTSRTRLVLLSGEEPLTVKGLPRRCCAELECCSAATNRDFQPTSAKPQKRTSSMHWMLAACPAQWQRACPLSARAALTAHAVHGLPALRKSRAFQVKAIALEWPPHPPTSALHVARPREHGMTESRANGCTAAAVI
jgi:hypothetical protein